MMHLAMHDALNAIVPVYETLRIQAARPVLRIRSLRWPKPLTMCSSR